MRRMALVLAVGGLIGCASSAELEEKARVHSYRADAAARNRDYDTAAKEKREADELHAKAVNKAYKEGRATDVTVPSAVPPPAPVYP